MHELEAEVRRLGAERDFGTREVDPFFKVGIFHRVMAAGTAALDTGAGAKAAVPKR